MYLTKVAVDEKTSVTMATIRLSDEIEIIIDESEKVATVFYNDIDFLVRVNIFVLDTIEKMIGATPHQQLFLVQILQSMQLIEQGV